MSSQSPMSPNILEFIAGVLDEPISPAQRAVLEAIYALRPSYPKAPPGDWLALQTVDALYGLPTRWESETPYTKFTGRSQWPKKPFKDVTIVCGRRSGKTGRFGVNIAMFEALLGGHEKHLRKTERGHIVLMAQSLKAVNEAMLLARAKIAEVPQLREQVDGEPTASEIRFKNRMVLSIWPCTFTSIRGLSIPVAILDEVGVWDVEGANPDREVLAAIRPAMATFKRPLLVKLSTPWAKAGVLWDDFDKAWGQDDASTLVWRAPTWYMNPAIPMDYFVQEFNRDPVTSPREYGAEFVDAEGAFLPWAAIQAAVDTGIAERSPVTVRQYVSAVDVAFKNDATVLCIAHREGETVVVDLWRAWIPEPHRALKLGQVVKDVSELLRAYHCPVIYGDQYAAEPVREAFQQRGFGFIEVAFTGKRWKRHTPDARREVGGSKPDIYNAMKTLLLQGRLRLLDCPAGVGELRWLETWHSKTGAEQIGCPTGKRDDHVSALALAVWHIWRGPELRPRGQTIRQTGPLLFQQQVIEGEVMDDALPEEHPLAGESVVEEMPMVGAGLRWLRGGR